MKIIYNSIIPFKGFAAINLFGILFARKECKINKYMLIHENIHTEQMKELWYIGFYILYILEWLIRLPFGNAYKNISFEKEAYTNMRKLTYIQKRPKYNWINYIKKS